MIDQHPNKHDHLRSIKSKIISSTINMKWLLALVPFVAAAPSFPSYASGDAPSPGQVKILKVGTGGTGCPQGTVNTIISDDQSVVTLIYDSYVASIGPSVALTEQRKNCQLTLELQYPGGFQYSVLSADYRGYANIEKGITGTLKSTYYFAGLAPQTSTEYTFTGPVTGDYLKHDEADSTSVVMSPCGSTSMLNINSQVRLTSTNSKASGLLTTDSTDLKFKQVVYVQWKKCTQSS
ncbi:hypothetical protein OPT61_g4724 [Boeremia exigua]|uniref:Uncharacterized protein n=1 Tax=Boeremia exigua TaxID=749465 RepID=A0ACC2ID07_9PLEO|nr:hypothetical protein OPT61_g4724 [Boeremia exigua]